MKKSEVTKYFTYATSENGRNNNSKTSCQAVMNLENSIPWGRNQVQVDLSKKQMMETIDRGSTRDILDHLFPLMSKGESRRHVAINSKGGVEGMVPSMPKREIVGIMIVSWH